MSATSGSPATIDGLGTVSLNGATRTFTAADGGSQTGLNVNAVVTGATFGVTKSGAGWWQAVRQAARATALPEVQLELVPAGLGDDAPLWGAVALAPL